MKVIKNFKGKISKGISKKAPQKTDKICDQIRTQEDSILEKILIQQNYISQNQTWKKNIATPMPFMITAGNTVPNTNPRQVGSVGVLKTNTAGPTISIEDLLS